VFSGLKSAKEHIGKEGCQHFESKKVIYDYIVEKGILTAMFLFMCIRFVINYIVKQGNYSQSFFMCIRFVNNYVVECGYVPAIFYVYAYTRLLYFRSPLVLYCEFQSK
jgi:hypothetical protein